MGDEAGVAQTLHYAGSVAAQQGAYDRARELYHQSLETRRKTDPAGVASLVADLLQRQPQRRPADATEVADRLARLRAGAVGGPKSRG